MDLSARGSSDNCRRKRSLFYNDILAVTAKGNVVVLSWVEDGDSRWNCRFRVFSSLDDAAASQETNAVARYAVKKLGVPVEELDI